MTKYKYNVGEKLGPWNILFLERLDEIVDSRNRKPYGLFECPGCKKPTKSSIRNVVKGSFHWCPDCRSKQRRERMIGNSLGTENGLDLIGKTFNSWTVLNKTDKRQNGHILWHCICKCGYEQNIPTCNLTQNISTQCLNCSSKNVQSKGVKKIIKILDENNIKYQKEYSFKDCKYKRALRFDFYLPDYNCCIEYDGEQHFQNNNYFKNFEEGQIRDDIKNQYCKNNNIKLIRIPYWDLKKVSSLYLLSLIEGGDYKEDVSV